MGPFLDCCGIILPLGGEKERGWKYPLLGLGGAPVTPVASSMALPAPGESLGLSESCNLVLGQMFPPNPGPSASSSLEVLIQL